MKLTWTRKRCDAMRPLCPGELSQRRSCPSLLRVYDCLLPCIAVHSTHGDQCPKPGARQFTGAIHLQVFALSLRSGRRSVQVSTGPQRLLHAWQQVPSSSVTWHSSSMKGTRGANVRRAAACFRLVVTTRRPSVPLTKLAQPSNDSSRILNLEQSIVAEVSPVEGSRARSCKRRATT